MTGTATDPGQRAVNEDRVYANPAAGVFLVVDGLGGHAAGERAAQTAVEVIAREVQTGAGNPEQRIRRSITAANNEIFRIGHEDPECSGMGCVLTLALLAEGTVTVGHVGDSRMYLIWNGAVRKLTSDHSPVASARTTARSPKRRRCSIRGATRSSAMSVPSRTRRTTLTSSR
jgi:PPM family protein phosphatase